MVPLVIDATPNVLLLVAPLAYRSTISLSLRATRKAVGFAPAPVATLASAAMAKPPQCPEVALVQPSVSHVPVALLNASAGPTGPNGTASRTTVARLHRLLFILDPPVAHGAHHWGARDLADRRAAGGRTGGA